MANRRPHAMVRKTDAHKQQIIEQTINEGITNAYLEGQKRGYMLALESVHKALYAAALLTLRNQLKFGHKRAKRFLTELDSHVWNCIESEELIAEAFEKTGIKIDLDAVYDEERIKDAMAELRRKQDDETGLVSNETI